MNTKLANPKGSAQCTSWGEIEIQPLDFLFLNLQMFVILIKPEGLHSTLQKHSSSYPSSCLTSHSSLANGYMDFCQHCSTDVALVKVAINQLVNPTASTYSCPHPSLSCWCLLDAGQGTFPGGWKGDQALCLEKKKVLWRRG